MYSRCSHCQAQQTVNAEQLRSSRGLLVCSACGKRFDALVSLSDQANAELREKKVDDFWRSPASKRSGAGIWRIGGALSILILLAQILYFEGVTLSRQPQLRAGLLFICNRLDCRLPVYKNLDEWSVSHGDLRTMSDTNYAFSAVITNQAAFPQACPDIKLVLLNFNGQAVAERIFSSRQYSAADSLASNEAAGISLNIVTPPGTAKIGGYTFALL